MLLTAHSLRVFIYIVRLTYKKWLFQSYQVPTIAEWLRHEFQSETLVRIGADPMLVSAMDWKTWEEELGNETCLENT